MPENGPDDEGANSAGDDSPLASLTLRDALTALVAVALLVGLVGVVYVAVTPQQSTDAYTEFYVLGSEGNASEYPANLTVDERASVTVGVVNHEQRRMSYALVVRTDGRTITTRTLTVDNGERWEEEVAYALDSPGRIRVQFQLYRGSDPDLDAAPYRRLRLWTNVTAREA